MQNIKLIYLTIGLLAIITNESVLARGGYDGSSHGHGHSHLNLGIDFIGFYDPGFYGYGGYGYPFYSPYYYPPTVIVPSAPPVYIQQEQTHPVQPQYNYWYYCQDPEGYYPYVKNCPSGWQQVAPQPPAQ